MRTRRPLTTLVGLAALATFALPVRAMPPALGGLFRERGRGGGTRSVFLGDIPVAGELFRAGVGAQGATRARRGRADEVMVFLEPRIVRDTE